MPIEDFKTELVAVFNEFVNMRNNFLLMKLELDSLKQDINVIKQRMENPESGIYFTKITSAHERAADIVRKSKESLDTIKQEYQNPSDLPADFGFPDNFSGSEPPEI